jgi:hypothetical protein
MNLPLRVPMRIEYRKRGNVAVSLCYVLVRHDGVLWCANTLEGVGRPPLGLVTIAERDVQLAVRLDDGEVIA